MCTTTDTGRVGSNASRVISDTSARFSSNRCVPTAALADIGHHHAHLADLDHGLGDPLHRGEQAVDVIGALDQHLQLATLAPTGDQEPLGILKAVVEAAVVLALAAHHRGDDLA